MIKGCDYSYAPPGIAALKAAGVLFVCRYLTFKPAKTLTSAEAKALSVARISIVSNGQNDTGDYNKTDAAVRDEMRQHVEQHAAVGGPPGRPIYTSVDWDVQESEKAKILHGFDVRREILGDRLGVYGGRRALEWALKDGIPWLWQACGWRLGLPWLPQALIRQTAIEQPLGAGVVDWDEATVPYFGQWRVPMAPFSGVATRPVGSDNYPPEPGTRVPWRSATPIVDSVTQGSGVFDPIYTIGDTSHLQKHGGHTPWRAGSVLGVEWAADFMTVPAGFREWLLATCRSSYDTSWIRFMNLEGRQYDAAGNDLGPSGDHHWHLEVRDGHQDRHVTLVQDYLAGLGGGDEGYDMTPEEHDKLWATYDAVKPLSKQMGDLWMLQRGMFAGLDNPALTRLDDLLDPATGAATDEDLREAFAELQANITMVSDEQMLALVAVIRDEIQAGNHDVTVAACKQALREGGGVGSIP